MLRKTAPSHVVDIFTGQRPSTFQITISQTTTKGHEKAVYLIKLVAKLLHQGGISINVAVNNLFQYPMFNVVVRSGAGVKAFSDYALMSRLLGDLKEYIRHIHAKWVEYRRTVMLDD